MFLKGRFRGEVGVERFRVFDGETVPGVARLVLWTEHGERVALSIRRSELMEIDRQAGRACPDWGRDRGARQAA